MSNRVKVGNRRWNGWGSFDTTYPLDDGAVAYLSDHIGEGQPAADVEIQDLLRSIPPSQLPNHPLVTVDDLDRLTHARGQSLPDWIALRSGQIGLYPDGVAYPTSEEEIENLLALGREAELQLIPYGGGTSVVGHINPVADNRPILTIDLSRLNGLIDFDEEGHLATFEAGVSGPQLESRLHQLGFTLGHFPQSFEYSTLGGWVATRSSGQQSYYYGRIEDLFAGGRLLTPLGSLEMQVVPASAAGPDLRQLVLGSEGRLGILSQATVKVRPLPQIDRFYAVIFRDWLEGVEAVRHITQNNLALSMLRLSDAQETASTLALAGRARMIAGAERGLDLLGYKSGKCLLVYGLTGDRSQTGLARRRLKAIARRYGGLGIGPMVGEIWRKSRFKSPYLRNTLWDMGYAVDTLETAVPWRTVPELAVSIKMAINGGLEKYNERVLVFAHLSHIYRDGASIYVTYIFRRAADPGETLERWRVLKDGASKTILRYGGTISHQHGVGLDHAPYLADEKGRLGMSWLESVCRTADPDGLLNPGKLIA